MTAPKKPKTRVPCKHFAGTIRTLSDLYERCKPPNEEGCRIWGGKHGGKRAARGAAPCVTVIGLAKPTSLGAAVGFLKTGKLPDGKQRWFSSCGNPLCASHRQLGTHTDIMNAAIASGRLNVKARTAAMVAAVRAKSPMTPEVLAGIRACATGVEAARKYGIDQSMVSKIRRGESWRETVNSASVFNWQPTPPARAFAEATA